MRRTLIDFSLHEVSLDRLACLSLVSTTGQILASIFVGHIADLKGRCFVIRHSCLLVAACCGLSAVAPSLQILALARFLGGLGYGSPRRIGGLAFSFWGLNRGSNGV